MRGHVLVRKDKKGDKNVSIEEHGIGVYPSILEFLFDSRKKVKLTMEHLNERLDEIDRLPESNDNI